MPISFEFFFRLLYCLDFLLYFSILVQLEQEQCFVPMLACIKSFMSGAK